MIKQNPMIGWMLADTTMAMLGVGVLALACLMSAWTPPSKFASMTTQIHQLEELDQARQAEINHLTETLLAETEATAAAEAQAARLQSQEQTVRQELLGLRGSMERTIFLIDMSGSMNSPMKDAVARANWGGDGSPWGFVRNQMAAWIRYLPVQHYRIIAFNHRLRHFPETSRWANRQDDPIATKQFLDALQPEGFTGTEQALRQAALWKPTSIVLITDGDPTGLDGSVGPAHAQAILDMVENDDWNTPINVVAANNYFNANFGTFLVNLAATSGGSFNGL